MSDSVKDFMDSLFKSQTTEPSATAAEKWIEKLASINDPNMEDKKMGKLREELNGMAFEDLTDLANQLVGAEEKTAAVEPSEEGLSEEEIELLKNVSYADYLRAQEELQKEAEEETEEEGDEEGFDPETTSAYDALVALSQEEEVDEEKTAEELEEEVPDHIRIGYEQGAAMAYGLSDGLSSINEEKTAETKKELIDFIEDELEKEAGSKAGAVARLRAMLGKGSKAVKREYKSLRSAARSPMGKQKKTLGKLRNVAAKGLYYGGIPAAAAGAGVAAGAASKKRQGR